MRLQEVPLSEQSELAAAMRPYQAELAQVEGEEADGDSLDYPYLPLYWTEPGREPYWILDGDDRVGFALVQRHVYRPGSTWSVSEFYIDPAWRRRGLGARAVSALFALRPGVWEVTVLAGHASALAFWTSVLDGCSGGHVERFPPGTIADWEGWLLVANVTPRRVVVAFPKIESAVEWERILSVRERFDPLARRIAPHLTLVSPFQDPMSDQALEQHLRSVAGGVAPFPVTLREITAHESEYLFLNVKSGNDALIHLHDALYTEALAAHRARTNTFVPHVTVGRVSPEELPSALDATAHLTTAIEASVDSISVYRIDADGTRSVLLEVELGTPSCEPP